MFATLAARLDIALTYSLRQMTSYAGDAASSCHRRITIASRRASCAEANMSQQTGSASSASRSRMWCVTGERKDRSKILIPVFNEATTGKKTSRRWTRSRQEVPESSSADAPDQRRPIPIQGEISLHSKISLQDSCGSHRNTSGRPRNVGHQGQENDKATGKGGCCFRAC